MKIDNLDNTFTFISRKDEWYDEGTKCELLANCTYGGLFKGTRNGSVDEEMCAWDEFDIYNKNGDMVHIEDYDR